MYDIDNTGCLCDGENVMHAIATDQAKGSVKMCVAYSEGDSEMRAVMLKATC
jgi:hypothetical protein